MAGNQFISAGEVIPMHIERYNSQTQKLLSVEDYELQDLRANTVGRFEFERAREKKIKAFLDAINTIVAKEKLLQFHNSGFVMEIIEEKKILTLRPTYDVKRLSFDEMLELKQFYDIAQIPTGEEREIRGISTNYQFEENKPHLLTESTESPVNVSFIELEQREGAEDGEIISIFSKMLSASVSV